MIDAKIIGDRIKELRKQRSLTQNQAVALLFGPYQPSVLLPERTDLNAVFPLPLSWDFMDCV